MQDARASSPSKSMTFQPDRWYSIRIPSRTDKIVEVEEAVIEAMQNAGFCESDIFAVRMAADEALANAIRHGNRFDPDKSVWVKFCARDSSVTVVVRDEGSGFDYSQLPDPTAPERIELPCGRGLLIINTYMDEVTFNEQGNEVTMTKRGRSG